MPYAMLLVFSIITFGGSFRYPFLALVLGSLLFSVVIKRGEMHFHINTNPARGSHWCWSFAFGTVLLHFL